MSPSSAKPAAMIRAGAEERRRRDPEDGRRQIAVASAGERVERDVHHAHDQIGDAEDDAVTAEGLRYRQRGDEHRHDRNQHRAAHHALVGIHGVRQPGIADPRPPQRREHEQPVAEAAPGRVVGHQRRDLREREHEHEIEEQLERRDPVLVLCLRIAHERTVPCRNLCKWWPKPVRWRCSPLLAVHTREPFDILRPWGLSGSDSIGCRL